MHDAPKGYDAALSIDLRVFDNKLADFGVGQFIERLGFQPTALFLHETYVGQIHSYDGNLDDTQLLPTWSTQRAIPGGQLWTRAQLRGLVDELHAEDVRFFQGAEAAWSVWPEYGELSRDTWIYEHLEELFVTYRNGVTTEKEMGMICPLKRLSTGVYYEDMLLRDALKYLKDFDMDGFFAADGFGGLCCKLADGDFSDDMVSQFTEHTGIVVPGDSIPERADFIWKNLRYEWATFYAERWAAFYRKLVPAFKAAGKELIVMAPFKHGPAESFMEYGFDYRRNAEAGLAFYALESMETSSRRWQYTQAMEAVGIANIATIKTIAPKTRVYWMSSVCNCPEHWHTLRDVPNALERECFALNTARAIGDNGMLVKGFDGVQPLFGIDLSAEEWRWYKKRLDEGHTEVSENGGLAILWEDEFIYEHARRGEPYYLANNVVKLRFAGLPIHTACEIANARYAKNKTLLLVDPLGIRGDQVVMLRWLVEEEGKLLLVVGRVEDEALLNLLGIEPFDFSSSGWRLCSDEEWCRKDVPEYEGENAGLGGYIAKDAGLLVEAVGAPGRNGAALTVRKAGKGLAVFMRQAVSVLPPARHKRSPMDWVAHPNLKGPENDLCTIGEVMRSLSRIHPDSLYLICARCVQHLDGTFAYSEKGQVLSYADGKGIWHLLCENPMNFQYCIMTVTLPHEKMYVQESPLRNKGPIGYIYFGDARPDRFDICVPPEAAIPIRVLYKEQEGRL